MKLLVTGSSGLTGSKIVEVALILGHEVYSGYLTHPPILGNPLKINVTVRSSIVKTLRKVRPDAVIHCAALTDVDKCELERELTNRVNIYGAKLMAEACEKIKAHFTFLSTDYVFDGLKGMYCEEDEPNPINYYGYSKWVAENIIAKTCVEYLIARTSLIYGSPVPGRRTNFALRVIHDLSSGRKIKASVDQFSSPTLNTNVATMILEAVQNNYTGTYHLAGASRISRYDFAVKLANIFKLNKELIDKGWMEEEKWIAKRPMDSSLNVEKAISYFSNKPLKIEDALNKFMSELKSSRSGVNT